MLASDGTIIEKELPYNTPRYIWYNDVQDYLLNLGYHEQEAVSVNPSEYGMERQRSFGEERFMVPVIRLVEKEALSICKIKLLKIPPVYVMIHKYPCEVFHK